MRGSALKPWMEGGLADGQILQRGRMEELRPEVLCPRLFRKAQGCAGDQPWSTRCLWVCFCRGGSCSRGS